MKLFGPAARLMVRGVTRFLPCSAQDEARLRELAVPADNLTLTGNIKLDVQIPLMNEPDRIQFRRDLGLPEGLVLLDLDLGR